VRKSSASSSTFRNATSPWPHRHGDRPGFPVGSTPTKFWVSARLRLTLRLYLGRRPGVTIGRRHFPLTSFPKWPILGRCVRAGGHHYRGLRHGRQGWRMLWSNLSWPLHLAAVEHAGARWPPCMPRARMRGIRRQFNQPIGRLRHPARYWRAWRRARTSSTPPRSVTAGAIDGGESPRAPCHAQVPRHRTRPHDRHDGDGRA